jgi:cyclomaltodextrinase / maltogenic alpha-amylase / neopullulanase
MHKNLTKNILLILAGLFILSCGMNHNRGNTPKSNNLMYPSWSKDAIWYQIFPERFSNGDKNNDPTIESLDGTWPYDKQVDWEVMPWTDDWYKLQSWEVNNNQGFYYNAQLRRYGGDLQGIINKLDYLKDLGINAIYLNPIFESPSSHKYGAKYFHHIDNNFGPDPIQDEKIWAAENPNEPETWQWTSADKLFLKLIQEVHSRDMRIIIDGVFNHVGIPFWALEDVAKNGKSSNYVDWFTVKSWDNPNTPENEFEYEGWFGIKDLAEFKEDEFGLIPPVKAHIKAITERWMDPDGDGDPEDGIDGWRLDVADMVNINFWKVFRGWVEEINPDAYLTGEVWWEDFMHNKMFNAYPWLKGDAFHAVMNYRFGDAMFKFFINQDKKVTATEFANLINGMINDYGYESILNIQNLIGSHDNERFASACANPDRWIDHSNNMQYNPEFIIRKPNQFERKIQKQIIAFQFMFPGAPYIYYGDEVGMWGADDPDERKPMVWSELTYEDETHHPFGEKRQVDTIEVEEDMLTFYKWMISLRNNYSVLRNGDFEINIADDNTGIFIFTRMNRNEKIISVFNSSIEAKKYDSSIMQNMEQIAGDINDEDSIDGKSFKIYYELINE